MRCLHACMRIAAVLPLFLAPNLAHAETLQIMRGIAAAPIRVMEGATITVDSDTPFLENSIANPAIADFNTVSDQQIALTGVAVGRTTLTMIHDDNSISNVEVLVRQDGDTAPDLNPARVPPMPDAQRIAVINGIGEHVVPVPQSGAIVIRTDLPFVQAGTIDRGISDTSTLADDLIYVLGKKPGTTTLILSREADGPPTTIRLEVTPNMDGME